MAVPPITFEDNDLLEFDATTTPVGVNSIGTSMAAAMYGVYGMYAEIIDQNAVFGTVNDDNLTRMCIGFYFDPNSVAMAIGNKFVICGGGTLDSDYKLEIRWDGVDYKLNIDLNTDGGWVESPQVTLTDAVHWLEMDLAIASAPAANDGFAKLWIDVVDATPDSELANVNNDTLDLDRIGIGVNELDIGTKGTIYFDQLTWNYNGDPIGPPWEGYAWIF